MTADFDWCGEFRPVNAAVEEIRPAADRLMAAAFHLFKGTPAEATATIIARIDADDAATDWQADTMKLPRPQAYELLMAADYYREIVAVAEE